MATVTHKLTTYSSLTITYTVTQTDTRTTVTVNSVKFTNSRSSGTTSKVSMNLISGTAGIGQLLDTTIAKGTKTKTWSFSNKSSSKDKAYSLSTIVLHLQSHMTWTDPDSGDAESRYKVTETTISIPAKTSYAVTYDANGGSGAPPSQTKWYNEALTLQSTRPSRENHSFLGWGTGAGAAEAAYQPSAGYTANAALALYAVWRQVYASPGLSITRSYRCDSTGAPSDDGAWAAVELAWNTFDAGSLAALTATVNGATVGLADMVDVETAEDGKSGTAKAVIDAGMAVELAYAVTAAVEDAGCSAEGVEGSSNAASRSDAITRAYYTMQFRAGGVGAAIGLPASSEDFNIGLPVNLIRTALVRGEHIDLWPGGINLCDKAGEALGFMQPHQRVDGRDGLQIGTGRNIDGADVWNTLALTIDEEGTPNVEFQQPKAWVDALAKAPNRLLWSGAAYMNADQTITLSEKVSAQPRGIVVVFSGYNSGAQDNNFNFTFVPKGWVTAHGGCGITCMVAGANVNPISSKYLYITESTIKGYSTNGSTGTSNGISWKGNVFVLREVWGV